MKEPTGHYEYEDEDYGLEGICSKDGEEWPCPTWKKWIKSDSYRIKELESKVERLVLDSAGNRKELADLREGHRRLNLFVRAGIAHLVGDLAAGRPAGVLSENLEVDYQDFTSFSSRTPTRVKSAEHYTVTYEGQGYSGVQTTWENGVPTKTFGR